MKVSRCPSTETSPCVKLWDPRFGHSERSGLMRSFGSFLHHTVDGPAKSCTTNLGWLKHVETHPKSWDVYHLLTGDNRISQRPIPRLHPGFTNGSCQPSRTPLSQRGFVYHLMPSNGVMGLPTKVPSGKRLQFANLKMAIEIVSCPINSMVIFQFVLCGCLPEGSLWLFNIAMENHHF